MGDELDLPRRDSDKKLFMPAEERPVPPRTGSSQGRFLISIKFLVKKIGLNDART